MRLFKFALAGLLWILVILCLGLTALPYFLDRIYYRGPASAHFDGARFANPDGADTDLAPATRNRFLSSSQAPPPSGPRCCSGSEPSSEGPQGRSVSPFGTSRSATTYLSAGSPVR